MDLIQVKILVDTDKLLNEHPGGGDVGYGNEYIKMSVVDGVKLTSEVTGNNTAELGFKAAKNSYLRFFCLSSNEYGDVKIVGSGSNIPRQCLKNGSFFFENGNATGQAVNETVTKTAYNFVIRVDDFDFTFVWDPFLGVQ